MAAPLNPNPIKWNPPVIWNPPIDPKKLNPGPKTYVPVAGWNPVPLNPRLWEPEALDKFMAGVTSKITHNGKVCEYVSKIDEKLCSITSTQFISLIAQFVKDGAMTPAVAMKVLDPERVCFQQLIDNKNFKEIEAAYRKSLEALGAGAPGAGALPEQRQAKEKEAAAQPPRAAPVPHAPLELGAAKEERVAREERMRQAEYRIPDAASRGDLEAVLKFASDGSKPLPERIALLKEAHAYFVNTYQYAPLAEVKAKLAELEGPKAPQAAPVEEFQLNTPQQVVALFNDPKVPFHKKAEAFKAFAKAKKGIVPDAKLNILEQLLRMEENKQPKIRDPLIIQDALIPRRYDLAAPVANPEAQAGPVAPPQEVPVEAPPPYVDDRVGPKPEDVPRTIDGIRMYLESAAPKDEKIRFLKEVTTDKNIILEPAQMEELFKKLTELEQS